MAYNNLGRVLADRGNADAAVDAYHKALEIKPDYAEPHINLGMILADRGQADAAMAEYRKALDINSASVEAPQQSGDLARPGRAL